ncbi:MAG: hypothetical protein AB7P04_00170 [Bacteriovoracia bacterium]
MNQRYLVLSAICLMLFQATSASAISLAPRKKVECFFQRSYQTYDPATHNWPATKCDHNVYVCYQTNEDTSEKIECESVDCYHPNATGLSWDDCPREGRR